MLALIFGLVGALAAAPRVAADKVYGSSSTQAYANGNYGNIPSQSFYTRPDLTAPAVNIATSKAGQADGYLFTNWEGSQCPRSMPYIIDTNGHMVWMPEDAFLTHNFGVHSYNGEDVLSTWTGDNAGPYAFGKFSLLNSAYETVKTIDFPGLSNRVDSHEFQITSDNTFIINSYGFPRTVDLRAIGGTQNTWTLDAIFAEVDQNNNLLFNWSAIDHGVSPTEQLPSWGEVGDTSYDNPHDGLHINAVDKGDDGHYYVSLRVPSAIYKVNGQTGEVMWRLGGTQSDFKMNSGKDASLADAVTVLLQLNSTSVNPMYISVFDNQEYGQYIGRGLILKVDTDSMEVDYVQQYATTRNVYSGAEGSAQVLPNNNVMVGYGFIPEFAEFDARGNLLFNMFFGASSTNTNYEIASYRVFKQQWYGQPNTLPDTTFHGNKFYASWNGATEVASWGLLASDSYKTMTLQDNYETTKSGFETGLWYPNKKYIAAVAFDADGNCLATSKPRATSDGGLRDFETSCSDVSSQTRPSIRFSGNYVYASWPGQVSQVASWGLLASNSYKTMAIQPGYQKDKTGSSTALYYPLQKYIAGVAFDRNGNCIATSKPRRISDGAQVDFVTSCRDV